MLPPVEESFVGLSIGGFFVFTGRVISTFKIADRQAHVFDLFALTRVTPPRKLKTPVYELHELHMHANPGRMTCDYSP